MDAAEPGEGGVLEAGDHAEDLGLRAVLHLGLEADEVVERAERVVAAELDDGVGLHVGRVRVGQADRLHRAEAQGLAAALGHHLDRQAALEVGRSRSQSLNSVFSAARSASTKASYWSRSIGQLR